MAAVFVPFVERNGGELLEFTQNVIGELVEVGFHVVEAHHPATTPWIIISTARGRARLRTRSERRLRGARRRPSRWGARGGRLGR
eukprot:8632806-Pyramimonas_sp.AAC.1